MDEINRVKNIKEKFEGRSHVGMNYAQTNEPINTTNESKTLKIISKASATNETNISHRANIKRTPAFRKDKVPLKNVEKHEYISKSADSLVTNRVHLFNKLKDTETSTNVVKKESLNDEIKENKPLKIEPQTEIDINALKLKNITELKQFINQAPYSTKCDLPVAQYAKVKKSPKNKIIKGGNKSQVEHRPIHKQRSAPEMAQSTVINGVITEDLSDTLKRVLRSPLPPGPPPKKPPRTFVTSKTSGNTDRPVNDSKNVDWDNKSSANYGKINSPSREEHTDEYCLEMPKPIRSKTESEIMLRKIENALLKHREHAFSAKEGNRNYDMKEKAVDKGQNLRKTDTGISCFGASQCTSPNEIEIYSKSAFNKISPEIKNAVFNSDIIYASINSRKSEAHIYEDPNELLKNSLSPCEDAMDSNLYYMSTPIESIINSPEMAHLNESETRDTKAIKDIADILDKTLIEDKKSSDVLADPSMENKIKLWMNEAYGKSLKNAASGNDSDLGMTTDEIDGLEKEENHTEQCDQVTLLRKGYVQKVASRTSVSRQQSILAQFSDCKHLFECLLLIGLNLDTSNNKVPYIKMKYPANTNVPQCIEHLCFPDAHEWSIDAERKPANNDKNRYYSVTVTTEGGQRKYVYCRRIKPEGESALLPLSYCILSPHKANDFYSKILEEVEARHGKTEVEFFNFIRELYESKFPTKGQGIIIRPSIEERIEEARDQIIRRSSDSRTEDLQLAITLEYLKINVFLLIFSSMLLERKVILLSSSISKLSSCIEGLQIALLPFQWQHTLITVVPSSVVPISDLCEAPTPYLIGLLKPSDNSQILSSINSVQQVIVVDIDDQKVVKKVGDEQSILPIYLVKGLKNALQLAHSSEMQTNNLLACEAFTRLFVELVGHYRRFIISSNLDRIRRKTFQKEAFLRATSTHSLRMFLEWFVETAAFSAFIETHLQNYSDSRGLFEQRCNEYLEEVNRLKSKNNKMLKTVRQIGDFFKDLTIAP